MITAEMVRDFLVDRFPKDNFLLDAIEYSDEQICAATKLMVSRFNETDPILNDRYTPENFPFDYTGVIGVAANLIRSKAINMTRNRLHGNGQIVDDKQNADAYLQIAASLSQEFQEKTCRLKGDININGPAAYGRVGGFGPYRW